jgi:hypothetical protein
MTGARAGRAAGRRGMADSHRTGDPTVDAKPDAADALQQELADQMATMQAESVIRSARMEQLRTASGKAYRRIAAMRGQVTRAERGGDPEKVAAAQAKLATAQADFDRISRACIDEGGQIVGTGLDQLGVVLADMSTVWKVEREATAALARKSAAHQ